MATSKDIAKIIASQHGIKPAEAENFIQQLVDTINEGIETDRLVKIKGFGTFKMQSIKPRSSVNVNTGERVVIGEHDRITFLPDA
jgi:nucleoid DNA-binding protein